jgi:hypothetical protein
MARCVDVRIVVMAWCDDCVVMIALSLVLAVSSLPGVMMIVMM